MPEAARPALTPLAPWVAAAYPERRNDAAFAGAIAAGVGGEMRDHEAAIRELRAVAG